MIAKKLAAVRNYFCTVDITLAAGLSIGFAFVYHCSHHIGLSVYQVYIYDKECPPGRNTLSMRTHRSIRNKSKFNTRMSTCSQLSDQNAPPSYIMMVGLTQNAPQLMV